MKRTVVFAHYDVGGIVDSYVIYYLRALRRFCNQIIFVSDGDLSLQEQAKVDADHIIVGKYVCNDFGSYKRGFELVDSDSDQLVFCNDSCYLIGDLAPIFHNSVSKDFDFFGLTVNSDSYLPHLQSYFLTFNNNVFTSKAFREFIDSIGPVTTKDEIIKKYEVFLTQYLVYSGYRYKSLVSKIFSINPAVTLDYWKHLLPAGFPFMKVDLLKNNPIKIKKIHKLWQRVVDQEQLTMIKVHLRRLLLEGHINKRKSMTAQRRAILTK